MPTVYVASSEPLDLNPGLSNLGTLMKPGRNFKTSPRLKTLKTSPILTREKGYTRL